jgi:RimJ/RimL family protein N-acetyltransferase
MAQDQSELTDGVVTLRPERDRHGFFSVVFEGRRVGTVGVTEQPDGRGRLSWELEPNATGHGYATRAVRLLVDYAFRAVGLDRVEA